MGNGNGKDIAQLDNIRRDIEALLDNPETSTREMVKGLLRANRDMIPFLTQAATDHRRIEKLENFYGVSLWVAAAFGVLVVGLLWGIFTGQATVSFSP